MSKRKMYLLLTFIIFTFTLLAIVIVVQFNHYSINGEQSDSSLETADTDLDQTKDSDSDEGSTNDTNVTNGNGEVVVSPSPTVTPEPAKDITMLFTGDIYLSDYVINKYTQDGIDGIVGSNLQDELKRADLTMVNQEFTFSNRGVPMDNKQYTFRVDPKYVQVFKDLGIDIATLANNHSMDFGLEAFSDSFDTLNKAGILYVGVGNNLTEARDIKYIDINNKKIAVLGASRVIPETNWNATSTKAGMLTTYDPSMLLEDIQSAAAQSDFVVVYLHWGIEKSDTPEEYQRYLAKQYIDAGADLVVGSHPHVLQGVEYYNGKPIIYSLGNFIFYNSIKQTAVCKVTIDENNIAKVQLLPAKAENACTSLLTAESDINRFYEYMTSISYVVSFDEDGFCLQ